MANKNQKNNFKSNTKNKNSNIKNEKKKTNAYIKNQLNEKVQTGLIDGVFVYSEELSIKDFAAKINKNPSDIIKYFFTSGLMMNINQLLTEEQMGELCLEYGYDFQKEVSVTKENIFDTLSHENEDSEWNSRPPVVTIVGHVDHGKTTLLDALRDSSVAAKEHGGITQHIGAYQIKYNDKVITFLDTPGHEAFSEMRARGTNITDIVILVVAADDGIMPQTQEAIDHAKAANVNIIVFINKCDKPGAKPEVIKSELMNYGIVAEEFGGEVPFIIGSAKAKTGLNELIETITVISDINELKAIGNTPARGVVIESNLDKNKGPVATILLQHGTLKIKDVVVAGGTYGTIKDITDENGKKLNSVIPSQPAVIMGLSDTPFPGDKFLVVGDDKTARDIAEAQRKRAFDLANNKQYSFSIDMIKDQIDSGELKSIAVIIKADTQGSVEALRNSLLKINIEGVKIKIIRASVGGVSQSDITLALASNAIVYGFNVRPNAEVRKKAEEEKVEIRLHNVVYRVLEEIQEAASGMLDPTYKEVVTGQAEVRALFRHSKIGTIAGCFITSGSIFRASKARIIRDGVVIYDGEISSLKHEKNEIKEAREGFECGLTIKNFNDIKESDIIEGYKNEEVEKDG